MKPKLAAAVIAALALCVGTESVPASAQESQQGHDEGQMGRQLFNQLRAQGEIVASSPLYATLQPLSQRITRVVASDYAYPIHFYIVHESQPNAFAAPGGNVYVTDSLFYFVRNTEELAGTICHETSHLLHHDSAQKMKAAEQIRARAIAATILLGPTVKTILAVSAIGQLDSLHYSRAVEERADLTGSDTCALAGYNPWGLIWLFKDFSSANMPNPPEILSDHPDFDHRVAELEHHFEQNPTRFAHFNTSAQSATALHVASNEPERFLR